MLDKLQEEEKVEENDSNTEDPVEVDDDNDDKVTEQSAINVNRTDEFRQLRSYVPRTPFAPMTLAEQEKLFPGLSALIKRPAHHRAAYGDVITARQYPIEQPASAISFDFPSDRSARNHKKMRFPLDS